jgi:hypothetical protein
MSAASGGNGAGNGSRPTTASSQQSGQSADLRGVAAMVDSPFAGKHYIGILVYCCERRINKVIKRY